VADCQVEGGKVRMEELGQIKFLGEREIKMVEMKFDMDDIASDKLASIGFNRIKYDRKELASYAIKKLLEEYVERKNKCKPKKRSSKRSSRR
jgi:hypothetical protein